VWLRGAPRLKYKSEIAELLCLTVYYAFLGNEI
jgi:hypothetical protein